MTPLLALVLAALFVVVIASYSLLSGDEQETTLAQAQENFSPTKDWTYTFTDPQLTTLKKDGWFLMQDSLNLDLWSPKNHPDSAEYLTLRTLLGDHWLENVAYKPYIINKLAHKVEIGDCAEIEVKLLDFNPYSRYQQAGFFLYYSERDIPSLSYNHAGVGKTNHVQISLRNGMYSNEHLAHASRYGHKVILSKIDSSDTPNAAPVTKLSSLNLKMRLQDGTYFFSYSIDGQEYRPIRSSKLDLPRPEYIVLAAFQGRPDIPYPVWPVADVIDARFEYVRVRRCE